MLRPMAMFFASTVTSSGLITWVVPARSMDFRVVRFRSTSTVTSSTVITRVVPARSVVFWVVRFRRTIRYSSDGTFGFGRGR